MILPRLRLAYRRDGWLGVVVQAVWDLVVWYDTRHQQLPFSEEHRPGSQFHRSLCLSCERRWLGLPAEPLRQAEM